MTTPTDVALVAARTELITDPELPLLADALRTRGRTTDVVAWDDPAVDWGAYGIVLIRSCWDYVARREEFLAWAGSVPRLHNGAEVIAWNTDKVYLRDLAANGCPVIETSWNPTAEDELGDHGEWVCKPSVSCASRDTARWASPEEVIAHSLGLQASGRTAMVQPYVASVDDEGETALLFAAGELSHCVRKGPLLALGEGIRQDRADLETISPGEPTDAQLRVADLALAAATKVLGHDAALLYARVDLVTAPDGEPVVLELELTEPSFFLRFVDGSADRFARAIESYL